MAISANTTYEILPVEDVTLAMEVAGNSTANKANVRLWSRNGGNSQKWKFVSAGTTDVWYMTDAETGKAAEIFKAIDTNGANVSMYTGNQSTAQRWKAEYVGTQEVNGTNYETYQFVAFGGSTSTPRCMDVQGNGSYIRSNIQIWSKVAGHPSQTFALVPTEWNAIGGTGNDQTVLPTPSGGTGGTTRTPLPGVCAIASGTLYPAWLCGNERLFQVRYRTRTREESEDALSDWSDWMSIKDGTTGFDGYGAVGESNVTAVEEDGLLWSPYGALIANGSTYDRTDVQFEARAWSASWGYGSTTSAHGNSQMWEMVTVRPVTVSSLTATLSADGLEIAWVTDCTRSASTVSMSSELFGTARTHGEAVDSYVVPVSSLTHAPTQGESLELSFSMTTEDGLSVNVTRDVSVAYAPGFSLDITLTATVSGSIATIASSNPNAIGYLVIPRGHGDRLVKLDGSSPWTAAPPLGVPWSVYAVDDDGESWGSVTQEFDAIPADGYHVTSQGMDRDLRIVGNASAPPTFAPRFKRSVSTEETYGRERPVATVGNVTSVDWTLNGVLFGDDMASDIDAMDWAAHAGHVYFRSPRGYWAQAVVTSAQHDLSSPYESAVTLSLSEEVW